MCRWNFVNHLAVPDPVILFPRAKLSSGAGVSVHPDATVIFGDALLLHDPKGVDGSIGCTSTR